MIERLSPQSIQSALPDLTEVLHATVHDGASVGFVLPFEYAEAEAFWQQRVLPSVKDGAADLFVSKSDDRIVGTVQLVPATMPNQPHRADVSKLLVHPDARRKGIARALLQALETRAKEQRLTLLTLDTRSTDPSLHLYLKQGFQIAGEIPNFCRNPFQDVYEATTYMYKELS